MELQKHAFTLNLARHKQLIHSSLFCSVVSTLVPFLRCSFSFNPLIHPVCNKISPYTFSPRYIWSPIHSVPDIFNPQYSHSPKHSALKNHLLKTSEKEIVLTNFCLIARCCLLKTAESLSRI